jgi:hypothetical protein
MKAYLNQIVMGIVIIVLALLLIDSCNKKHNADLQHNNEKIVWEQNEKALKDTVRTVKNKIGEKEQEINNYIATKDNLKDVSVSLSNELKKEKGKVLDLTQALFSSKMEPVKVDNTVIKYSDNSYGLKFKYEDGDSTYHRIIQGISRFSIVGSTISSSFTEIDTNNFKFKLIMGHRKTDAGYVYFARTAAPGITLLNAESVLIIDKVGDLPQAPLVTPKKWGIGFQFGYGLTPEFKLSPYLGIGLNYSIIRF